MFQTRKKQFPFFVKEMHSIIINKADLQKKNWV